MEKENFILQLINVEREVIQIYSKNLHKKNAYQKAKKKKVGKNISIILQFLSSKKNIKELFPTELEYLYFIETGYFISPKDKNIGCVGDYTPRWKSLKKRESN